MPINMFKFVQGPIIDKIANICTSTNLQISVYPKVN